jgi:hypothetical protein
MRLERTTFSWDGFRARSASVLSGVVSVTLLLLFLGYLSARRGDVVNHAPAAPDELSTSTLETELDEALEALVAAASALDSEPESARRLLTEARGSLLKLRLFYLPLTRARAAAHDAYRSYQHGEADRALRRFVEIESTLLSMSDRGDPQLSREAGSLLAEAAEARVAVRARRSDALKLLERLASRFDLLLLKGDLALQGTRLEER